MSETDACIVGIQKCGCITYANSRPDNLEREDSQSITRIIRDGGQVVRTTVGEARAMPHFLEWDCPHNPKGWERGPDPRAKLHMQYTYRPGVRVVKRDRLRLGEVRKRDGAWEATRYWFNDDEGAHAGNTDKTPAEVLGPFKRMRDAMEALASKDASAEARA